ncbi:uncharacterized protein LOC134280394 [Saccostrea cucullata]|uniref:uncharacterized protein LOC134280394 n=1 Tax=Saccostrea cuccullata TaxID=36930 RepID=UPI002ED48741
MSKRKRTFSGREKKAKERYRKRRKREEKPRTLTYSPITKSWAAQKREEQKLTLQNDHHLYDNTSSTKLGHPSKLQPTSPNGNCFFNALSFILTGTEKFHSQIRANVCDFISTHSADLQEFLPNTCQGDGKKYLNDSSMRVIGTWASETEIFAAAYMLNTEIYVYTKYGWQWKWLRHSPPEPANTLGIYLYHHNLNHYEVVLEVAKQNSKNLKNQERYFSNRENERNRKRTKYASDSSAREAKKLKMKVKYHSDVKSREYIRKTNNERQKKKYNSNTAFRRKQKQRVKHHYETSSTYRNLKLMLSRMRYLSNAVFRQSIQKIARKRYIEDYTYQNKMKTASKKKYKTNTGFRQSVKESSKKKYKTNPGFRQSVKHSSKKKYKTNPDFRQSVKQSSKKKYKTNPDFRQSVKQSSKKKYKANPDFRQSVKESSKNVKNYSKQKYNEDKDFKQHVKSYSKMKYKVNADFRQCVRASSLKRYASRPLFRYKLKKYLSHQYHSDRSIKRKKKETVRLRRKSLDKALQTFLRNIGKTPKYTCTVCARILFKEQVKLCNKSKYIESKYAENAKKCLIGNFVCDSKEWICITCDKHLSCGNMPPQALANGLHLNPMPEELSSLNSLERQLVALRIPFMKILSLPRGGQRGVKGQVVNVPSNINSVTSSLPRSIEGAQMIKVKLKRKLSYKGYQQYEWIRPTKVIEAVKYLVENNCWYSQITLNDNWFDTNNDSDLVREENMQESSDDENPHDTQSADSESAESDSQDKDAQIHPIETCSEPLDLGQEFLDTDNKIFCVAPGEGQTPQSIFQEKGAEAMAFPALLPNGKYGFSEERKIKLSPSKYFNSRLFCADTRFAKDNKFIFFAQFMIEMSNIKSNLSIALRKGKAKTDDGKKITASMLTNSENLQQILKTDAGFRFLQPVRGSPPYWQRTMKDLYAMIRQLGIPTWFVTFSAGETRWEETIDALKNKNDIRPIQDIEWTEKCQLIRENPVMCARLFNHRVQRLFTDLIMSPAQPVGEVTDFFYRTEFQQRGSPHIHCLLWVKNAPRLGKNTDKEICSFVDKYITCSLPDPEKDPDLNDIVKAVQMHNKSHTKSCKKHSTTCRFNFPRPPILESFIAKVPDDKDTTKFKEGGSDMPTIEEINKMCKAANQRSPKQIVKDVWSIISSTENVEESTIDNILQSCNVSYSAFVDSLKTITKRNCIYHKRGLSDTWVNNYNQTLLRAWNANMDIQYIMDPYSCVAYILSYISKAEAEIGELLADAQKEAREGNKDAASAMKQISHVYIQNREVSAQEAVYRICSMHLKECSRQVLFIPTGNDAFRMSLPLSALHSKEGSSEDIWMPSIMDKYYSRPDTEDFDDQCLAEFCSNYCFYPKSRPPKASKKNKDISSIHELQKGLGYIKRRMEGKEAIIRYPRFNRLKNPNDFYLSLLQLYLPHRRPIDLASKDLEEYIQHAKVGDKNVLDIVNQNRGLFEKDVQDLERAWEDVQEGRIGEDAWSAVAPECEAERLNIQEENKQLTQEKENEEEISPDIELLASSEKEKSMTKCVTQYQRPKLSQKEIQDSLRNMNEKQQRIFYQVREWVLKVSWNQHPEPLHVFVTGGAGTGKSHLIKCIYHETNRILSKTVENPDSATTLIAAPTGTAAFNIGGMTLHSAFGISKNIKLPYTPLGENILNTLRAKYENLKLIIIDEISMVDHKLLTYVHGRLTQIKQSKKVFGNVAVLAFGDFYQLPPVKASPLYKVKESVMVDLWNPLFSKATLTEIMRQKDDAKFAEMLNRLRIRGRGEPLLQQDIEMLQSVSCDLAPKNMQDALHIYSLNKDVATHNEAMVDAICHPCILSTAKDYTRSSVTGNLVLRYQPYSSSSQEDLPEVLKLGLNARVMLTRNIDTEDGLVNGAFGTITAIDQPQENNVRAVYVKFDNNTIGRKAKSKAVSDIPGSEGAVRITLFEDSLAGKNAVRRQFPLKLGWAATIHKVQGMTSNRVIVSLNRVFQPGMAYVALSRATALEGLRIINFDMNSIFASEDIKKALENMPDFLPPNDPNIESNSLKIALHNTEGLIIHKRDIESAQILNDAHVICFTETWLKKDDYIPKSILPNSMVYSMPRKEAYSSADQTFRQFATMERGGVAIFTRDVESTLYDTRTANLECVAVMIKKPISVAVLVIYRPPIYSLTKFKERLESLLLRIAADISSPVIILGDFNDNALNTAPCLQEIFTKYGYQQLVKSPTTESGTCLDLALVKGFDELPRVTVKPIYYSFHDVIYIECKT